jgi:hypothetical protein
MQAVGNPAIDRLQTRSEHGRRHSRWTRPQTEIRGGAAQPTFAMGVGLAGAVGAAATGLTDWSETDVRSRAGLIHGLLNLTRRRSLRLLSHCGGRTHSLAGDGAPGRDTRSRWAPPYLGGDLVYRQRIGLTHANVRLPEEFTSVIDSAGSRKGPWCARAGRTDVLLVRQHGRVALVHRVRTSEAAYPRAR